MNIESIHVISKYKLATYLLIMILGLFAYGCDVGGKSWETKDISGLMPDLTFQLIEANQNQPVAEKNYRGDILLMYFGYTQCPDVCSTTLLRLNNVITTLGKGAERIRILFVSIDPGRDTLPILKSYTHAFGSQVVGLRGDQSELRRLTKRYRVSYGYGKANKDGNYTVSHSSAVYVFDWNGEARLLLRSSDKTSAIHHDLVQLLSEATAG